MHSERWSIVSGWDDEEKAMFLTASLRGDSRKLLSGLTNSWVLAVWDNCGDVTAEICC